MLLPTLAWVHFKNWSLASQIDEEARLRIITNFRGIYVSAGLSLLLHAESYEFAVFIKLNKGFVGKFQTKRILS